MIDNNKNNKKNNKDKNSFIVAITYFIIAIAFVMAFNYARDSVTNKAITYNEFMQLLQDKEISKVVITSDNLLITPSENNQEYKGKTLYTANIADENLISALRGGQC